MTVGTPSPARNSRRVLQWSEKIGGPCSGWASSGVDDKACDGSRTSANPSNTHGDHFVPSLLARSTTVWQAALRALLEESALRPADEATAAAVVEDDREEHVDAQADTDSLRSSLSVGSDDDGACSSGGDGYGDGGTMLSLLAQRDELLR